MQDEILDWAIRKVRTLFESCESHTWVEPFVGEGEFLFAVSPEKALCFSSSLEEIAVLEWLRDGGEFRCFPLGESPLAEEGFILRFNSRPGWVFERESFESIDLEKIPGQTFLFCNTFCAPDVDPLRLARWVAAGQGPAVVFFQDLLLGSVYRDLGFVVWESPGAPGAATFLAVKGVGHAV